MKRNPASNPPQTPADGHARVRLLLAFDGGAYDGWQGQPNGRGVQNAVERALAAIFPKSAPAVTGSSRTDARVHALGMVAHFDVPHTQLEKVRKRLVLALNACLPDDIRVLRATRAPDAFHARFGATGKQYRYHVWNHAVANPLDRHRMWHVPGDLDLTEMCRAASLLPGTRDFRAFTSNRGGVLENPVRTLRRCSVSKRGPLLTITIEGDGFLYKMCRAIAGTLIQAGQGKIRASDIPDILRSGERGQAGMNAPAHGLTLWKVYYGRTSGTP